MQALLWDSMILDFIAGKVARLSQASPRVTGVLGGFLWFFLFFQTDYDVCVLRREYSAFFNRR